MQLKQYKVEITRIRWAGDARNKDNSFTKTVEAASEHSAFEKVRMVAEVKFKGVIVNAIKKVTLVQS